MLTASSDDKLVTVIDEFAKEYLHNELRSIRQAMVRKLDGLGEYDVRRPLTPTGTNLLGLIKHLALWEARYLGEVFGRPFPEPLPRWDDTTQSGAEFWATADETCDEIIDCYRRVWSHSDATISALEVDASGFVPWWPRPNVKLFNVLVHLIAETNRHAGHADILREQIDGIIGADARNVSADADLWRRRHDSILQTATDAARRS